MCETPQASLTLPAVVGPVERGVRLHRGLTLGFGPRCELGPVNDDKADAMCVQACRSEVGARRSSDLAVLRKSVATKPRFCRACRRCAPSAIALLRFTAPSVEGRILVERGASVLGAQTLAHVQAV
jgi:hypothetical protein